MTVPKEFCFCIPHTIFHYLPLPTNRNSISQPSPSRLNIMVLREFVVMEMLLYQFIQTSTGKSNFAPTSEYIIELVAKADGKNGLDQTT